MSWTARSITVQEGREMTRCSSRLVDDLVGEVVARAVSCSSSRPVEMLCSLGLLSA